MDTWHRWKEASPACQASSRYSQNGPMNCLHRTHTLWKTPTCIKFYTIPQKAGGNNVITQARTRRGKIRSLSTKQSAKNSDVLEVLVVTRGCTFSNSSRVTFSWTAAAAAAADCEIVEP